MPPRLPAAYIWTMSEPATPEGERHARGVLTDPVILLGSAVSAFGLIGIVDTAIAWKSFFQNFFTYWIHFRDALFSMIPLDIPSELKDIIIINISAASIILRSAYILDTRGIHGGRFLKSATLTCAIGSTIYAFLWPDVFLPLRESVRSLVLGAVDAAGLGNFARASLEVAVDSLFAYPIVALVLFIVYVTYHGLRGSREDRQARAVAVALLSNSMLVFAFVAAVTLLCARW